jgi:hypothetical protein
LDKIQVLHNAYYTHEYTIYIFTIQITSLKFVIRVNTTSKLINTLGRRLTTGRTYDHKKKMNKLIINQDVLLRTPITQVRRMIKM